MLDELNPGSARERRDGQKDVAPGRRDRDREVRSVVEREVPIGQHEDRALPAMVHAWLDGELPEAAVRQGDTARDVEFWRGITDQVERRRHLRTPEYVEAQIMSALPHHAPQMITPWFRREFVITPFTAVAVAGAIIAVAVAGTVALMSP